MSQDGSEHWWIRGVMRLTGAHCWMIHTLGNRQSGWDAQKSTFVRIVCRSLVDKMGWNSIPDHLPWLSLDSRWWLCGRKIRRQRCQLIWYCWICLGCAGAHFCCCTPEFWSRNILFFNMYKKYLTREWLRFWARFLGLKARISVVWIGNPGVPTKKYLNRSDYCMKNIVYCEKTVDSWKL